MQKSILNQRCQRHQSLISMVTPMVDARFDNPTPWLGIVFWAITTGVTSRATPWRGPTMDNRISGRDMACPYYYVL